MAIYSFKNERSENLLYQIAVNPDEKEYKRGLADWAIYYLALSPNSKRFLSCVEKSLHEEIKYFRGRYPELSETLFSPDDVILGPPILLRNLFSSLYDHYEMALYELYRSDDDSAQEVFPKFSEQYLSKQYFTLNLIRRLAALKKSLECNQTIPKNERERFEIVRRELAISHALSPFTGSHIIPYPTVFLKNGEDHFKTYFDEYNFGDCDNIVPAFE
jgi:hypothetical protein